MAAAESDSACGWPDCGFCRYHKKGSAAFALNTCGKPTIVDIEVPQYAFQVDYVTGEHVPVILIQAEKIGDKSFFGVRYVKDKSVGICLRNELSLRGSVR